MQRIEEIAEVMGLPSGSIEQWGRHAAKVPLDSFPTSNKSGKLVVVTAITPTPLGEGKSTTAVGLVQGLAKIGKRPCLTIRQPSLGPVFGHKGGGTGGGRATVEPASEINLHFTGDFHAIESAHNLLAAMTDNAVLRGQIKEFAAGDVSWRRVTDAEDRALRRVIVGVAANSGEGPLNETGYDISSASEVMATLALVRGYSELRERLSQIIVGWTRPGTPVTVSDIGAVGAMMALLRDAVKPNLAQTREGQPAVVHMGPFGNIAHGCSSILADVLATSCADYVVTEAGFGADLGFEKYMDIKIRQGAPKPNVAVVVATIRGLKWHGGVATVRDLGAPNPQAVTRGSSNLRHAISIVRTFGLKAVVALNRFPADTTEELDLARQAAYASGATAVAEAHGFAQGGAGMTELAAAVVESCTSTEPPQLLYDDQLPVRDKIATLAKKVYLADQVEWSLVARRKARSFDQGGWHYPVCMAKTHLSISGNPKLRGAPTGHTLSIRDLRLMVGARQIVALAGNIITLPGLPSKPNAYDIDLDDATGKITGILGA